MLTSGLWVRDASKMSMYCGRRGLRSEKVGAAKAVRLGRLELEELEEGREAVYDWKSFEVGL
jgi:DNA helicase IV